VNPKVLGLHLVSCLRQRLLTTPKKVHLSHHQPLAFHFWVEPQIKTLVTIETFLVLLLPQELARR
jgi:hypothetical protein